MTDTTAARECVAAEADRASFWNQVIHDELATGPRRET